MSVEVDGTDGLAKAGLAKETGRSAGKIGISIVIAMGLGYVFVVLCGRFFLSPSDYAVFLTFWGFLMGIGSAISPLEQELSRQSAVAALDGGRVGKSALRAVAVCVAVVVIVGLLSMIPPVNTKLFGDHFVLSVIVLVGGISFACQFGVRGLLIGQHQVKHFSWLVIAEAAVRAVVLGGLFLASLTHLVPLALAAAAGSLAWLIFTHPAAKLVDPHVDGESWRPISGRILLLMAAAGLQASVITGYPALVKLLAPAVDGNRIGGLFALLQIARVPLLLLAPLQALAVPLVIRLSSSQDGRHRLRKLMALGRAGAGCCGSGGRPADRPMDGPVPLRVGLPGRGLVGGGVGLVLRAPDPDAAARSRARRQDAGEQSPRDLGGCRRCGRTRAPVFPG
jgi:hypothetical protein